MDLWPVCARKDCGRPAFFKVKMEAGGEVSAYLCILCFGEIRECMAAIAALTEEERKALEASGPVPRIEV